MKKFLASGILLLIVIFELVNKGFPQTTGDFQTKAAPGHRCDFNAWNIYNAGSRRPAVFLNIKVNTRSVTLTTSPLSRFNKFTLVTGNFIAGPGNEMQGITANSSININGGLCTRAGSPTKIYNKLPVNAPDQDISCVTHSHQ